MTYPGGPSGYPGQGPQQPHQGPGYGPPAAGRPLNIPGIAYLVTAGLGVLNLFLGFAPMTGGSRTVEGFEVTGSGQSFYEGAHGWVPALLLIAGLTALFGILPGDHRPGIWPAVFAVGGTLPFLFTVFQISGLGTGGVLVLIFGILEMLAAVGAYLMDAGIIKLPPPSQPAYGHPGYGPPSGQQYPQQQPGQYGQPGAQTQYQPQQGAFPPPPGQQPPGTPPGGYPQQQG